VWSLQCSELALRAKARNRCAIARCAGAYRRAR